MSFFNLLLTFVRGCARINQEPIENYTEGRVVSKGPHQVQRKMDIQIDTADLTPYVKVPGLRAGRWTPVRYCDLIRVAAKRHQWREEISETLRYLNGEDDE